MKCIAFAKRNLKEIVRDPLSLVFCIGFPIIMLGLFQLIIGNMSQEEIVRSVPQFQINRLAPGIVVFGFSFISLFSGMLVSKDRTSSFLTRLRTSPMKASDFIIGYTIPLLPIALVQLVICYSISFIFGLKLTGELLLTCLALIPIAILFISLGLLLGTLFTDKSVGGVASVVVNLAAITSGMFMPLENMGKALNTIAYSLPFANALKVINCIIINNYDGFLKSLIITLAYIVVLLVLSILVFKKKMNSDKV